MQKIEHGFIGLRCNVSFSVFYDFFVPGGVKRMAAEDMPESMDTFISSGTKIGHRARKPRE